MKPLNTSEQNDNIFEQDYSFIELINDVKTKSPWKAKAHQQFNTKTHKQMKQLIGMTDFKSLKYLYAKQVANNTNNINNINNINNTNNMNNIDSISNNSDQVFLEQKSRINFKNLLRNNHKDVRKLSHEKSGNSSSTLTDKQLCSQTYSNGLPKCFDWRNVDGVNYDTPIKKQGDCGSCYSVAMISAVESRIRIKSKMKEQPQLSNNNVISCSRYNQGCNGGYPYLVAKQGYESGFSSEECSPYQETDQQCMQQCLDPTQHTVYKLNKYGYVGKDYYGSTDEDSMMREIKDKGPIVVALNAAPDLYYYSSGVFITNPQGLLEQSNHDDRMGRWMFTNHAVVCIGWGETFHQGHPLKYWILKNSWGQEWGQQGYFNMLRGHNLGAVENQAIYADPILQNSY